MGIKIIFLLLFIHAVPKSFKEQKNYREVFQLLTMVQNHVTNITTSGIGEVRKEIEPILHELDRIMDRLDNAIFRVGIIGLTQADKITFLNALLGKHFLLSSIQPQTAREIVIAHDISKPEGELYCTSLASGQKNIHQMLLKKTRGSEAGTVNKCDKLILHAPLKFLEAVRDVRLELSDTPGFGEAGEADIVNITMKDMCAFVLIMNSQNMKTSLEFELLHKLKYHHPQLFSKLSNRVLFLVNVHANAYSEAALTIDNASVSPEELPEYVSNFLKSPEFLDEDIQPQQVLIFHALWALRSRDLTLWPKDRKKAKTLCHEALQMLRLVGKWEEVEDINCTNMSTENINRTLSLLGHASHIVNVENHLRNMVVKNGMLILLESAVDDSVSVINNTLLPIILKLIEDEHIETKRNKVWSVEELDMVFEDLLGSFDTLYSSITSRSSTQKYVKTFSERLRESLKAIVSSQLEYNLRGTKMQNEQDIIDEMQKVYISIVSDAVAKITKMKLTLSLKIKETASVEIKQAFSNINASFTHSLSTVDSKEDSTVQKLKEELRKTVSPALDCTSKNSTRLVQNINTTEQWPSTKTVHNIDHYVKTNTELNGKTHRVCSGGFLGTGFLKSCRDVPSENTVYTADIDSFKSAFDAIIQTWLDQFAVHARTLTNEISNGTAAAGKKKLSNILKEPRERVTELLQSSQNSLNESQQHVAFLEEKYSELRNLAESLRKSV